jgi:hypothetical protein
MVRPLQMSAVYGISSVLGFCSCSITDLFSGLIPGALDLRMYSNQRDACHARKGMSLHDFLDVQRVILQQRKTKAVLPHTPSTSQTPTVVLSSEPKSLFPDYHYSVDAPIVTVSQPIFPLAPGERVLEALPIVRCVQRACS